jgi:hypothetical protein
MHSIENCPCPKCRQHTLVYDGMLAWRSGPRPPRSLASKHLASLPRADYEVEQLYHCQNCQAEFFADVEQRHLHLYEEGVGGQLIYNDLTTEWERRPPGW